MTIRVPSPHRDSPGPFLAGGPALSLLDQLADRLRSLHRQSDSGTTDLVPYLSLIAEFSGATHVACCAWQEDRFVTLASQGHSPVLTTAAGRHALARACYRAMRGRRLVADVSPGSAAERMVALPVIAAAESAAWSLVALYAGEAADFPFRVALLDRIAGAMAEARRAELVQQTEWELRATSAAMELISAMARAPSLRQAYHLLVNELQRGTDAQQVALGIVAPRRGACRLEAISNTAEFDHGSAHARHLTCAMDESLVRKRVTLWPPLRTKERYATRAHRQLTERLNQPAVCSVPLQEDADQRYVGVLTFAGRREVIQSASTQFLLKALAPHIASALELRRRAEPHWWQRAGKWLGTGAGKSTSKGWASRRGSLAAVFVLALFSLSWLPLPHRVGTVCELEPVVRRFAVAPYGGLLKSSLVARGDMVRQGQLLARMEDRELQWELSATLAELGRVRTKRNQAMNDHDVSHVQLAELEMEQLQLKVQLLQQRASQMEIVSPVAGVVLDAPLEDAETAPVRMGQMLFEIAPLHRIRLVLSVAEIDLPAIRAGLPVTARLDGARGRAIAARLTRIQPSAQLQRERNLFLAEAELDNPDQSLRPGMRGRAQISAGYRPLGWIWFHKAWHRLQMALGI